MDKPSDNATNTQESVGAKIQYSYDPLGRLIQAESSEGAGHYSYDAVGNLTSIRRLGSGSLALIDFTPKTAPVGATVNIFGSGFNATPALDTVKFNGAAAVVLAASPTSLTVTVPGGATSGKISAHDTLGTALSSDDFMVLGMPPEPVVASFTPAVAAPGTIVTVTGSNFQSAPDDDKVEVGGQLVPVVQDATTPNATTLKFSVPGAISSGPVEVSTQFGVATSAAMLIIVPTGVVPGDVEASGTLAVDAAPITLATSTAGKKAAFAFTGSAGQMLHVRTQAGTFASSITANVYDPNGVQVEGLSLTNNSVADFTKRLTLDGNYVVVLNPATADKGSVQVSVVADAAMQSLALDTATPISLAVGQNIRLSFAAQANHGYGLALSPVTLSTGSGSVSMTLRKPDGTLIFSCSFAIPSSCDLDPNLFAASGTYLMDLDPSGVNAASFTLILDNDATGSVAVDASPATVTIARIGQNASYTFTGTAGQLVSVVLTGNTLDDGNAASSHQTSLDVYKPSSPSLSPIGSTSLPTTASGTTLDLTLPETGSYRVKLSPSALDKGTINLQVRSYATGTLAVNASTPVSLGAGQNARYTFSATAGTGYGLALTGLTFSPSPGSLSANLRKADGTLINNCSFGISASCNFAPSNFATTGSYILEFDPQGLATASFTAALSADPVTPITLDAAPTSVTIARPGQNARYTFAGTAGQAVTLVLTGNALDDGNAATSNQTQIGLYKPSNALSPLATTSLQTQVTGTTLDATLPETGTYTIFIDPVSVDAGTINIALKSYVTGTIALGTPIGVSLTAGRNARYSFIATAGTGYHVDITNLTFGTPPGTLQVQVRKADATLINLCGLGAPGGCNFTAANFPTAGTYYIDFDPQGLTTASFGAQLTVQ